MDVGSFYLQQLYPPLQLRNAILRNRDVIFPRSFNLAVAHLVAQQMRYDVHVGKVASVSETINVTVQAMFHRVAAHLMCVLGGLGEVFPNKRRCIVRRQKGPKKQDGYPYALLASKTGKGKATHLL